MKLNKPKFWDREISFYSIILLPFAFVFWVITIFKKKFSKMRKFDVPIICVGNIYIGGTGKTPTSIFLANALLKLGKNPAIVRKYYANHNDEYDLIKKKFNNLILAKNRILGINEALKSKNDIVILDDGFQDFTIKKDVNIICFNSNQLVGNGLIIPSGPLRQNLSAIKKSQIILINGCQNEKFEKKILSIDKNLEIFYSYYKPTNIDQFRNKKLLAIAGIGNPENFFQLIERNELNIQKKLIYPDHYVFSKNEIKNIINQSKKDGYEIIMTEKDYFKIKDFNFKEINYLRVILEIKEKENFLKKIESIYESN